MKVSIVLIALWFFLVYLTFDFWDVVLGGGVGAGILFSVASGIYFLAVISIYESRHKK